MRLFPAGAGALAVAYFCLPSAPAQTPSASNISVASKIVSAANAFLVTLDAQQRQSVMFAFDDEKQRQRWSNFPTGFVPRSGISLKQMNAAQRSAVSALLTAVLSERGYEKVQQIMEGDEVTKLSEGNGPPHRNGGGPPQGRDSRRPPPRNADGGSLFGKDLYYISFLGTPSETNPWILQFGGHHLALNITIAGERGVLTPSLTGAQPALYKAKGKTVRPLGQESDKGLALLNSLTPDQRKQAVLSYHLADLVLGPGQDGKTIQPEGLKASGMNDSQRTLLLDLISEWTGIIHKSAADSRMAEVKAGLNETWFAWSGPVTATPGSNITAYYRVQGPNLVIEYAPQELGGDPALHVHTMYRDPNNDYGRKLSTK